MTYQRGPATRLFAAGMQERQERMPIQYVQGPLSLHLSCPMHRNKAPRQIKRRWEPGGAACRQRYTWVRFARARKT
jgi:hypothetical protein